MYLKIHYYITLYIGIYTDNIKQVYPTVKRGFVIPAYRNDQYGVTVRSKLSTDCLEQRGEADIYLMTFLI